MSFVHNIDMMSQLKGKRCIFKLVGFNYNYKNKNHIISLHHNLPVTEAFIPNERLEIGRAHV